MDIKFIIVFGLFIGAFGRSLDKDVSSIFTTQSKVTEDRNDTNEQTEAPTGEEDDGKGSTIDDLDQLYPKKRNTSDNDSSESIPQNEVVVEKSNSNEQTETPTVTEDDIKESTIIEDLNQFNRRKRELPDSNSSESTLQNSVTEHKNNSNEIIEESTVTEVQESTIISEDL